MVGAVRTVGGAPTTSEDGRLGDDDSSDDDSCESSAMLGKGGEWPDSEALVVDSGDAETCVISKINHARTKMDQKMAAFKQIAGDSGAIHTYTCNNIGGVGDGNKLKPVYIQRLWDIGYNVITSRDRRIAKYSKDRSFFDARVGARAR